MKPAILFCCLALSSVLARAEEPPAPAPDAPPKADVVVKDSSKEAAKDVLKGAAPAPAPEAPKALKEEAKPAAPEPAKEEVKAPPKREVAAEKKAEAPVEKTPPKPKALSPEGRLAAQWAYLKEAAANADGDAAANAVAENLSAFVEAHPDAETADEALALEGALERKAGDNKAAMATLLRLLYEYPQSKAALRAKSDLLDLGGKVLSRKVRSAMNDLVKGSDLDDKDARLAVMFDRIVAGVGDALYAPTVAEIRRFLVRFPDSAGGDSVRMSLGRLHEKSEKYPAALAAYGELIAAYPASPYCAKAQFAIGGVYADGVRDYKKAVDAYQTLVEKYPGDAQALPALARTAELLSDRLKQYPLAVEIDEKIIKGFPKTDGALKAFNDEAKLLRDKLGKPAEAVAAYKRLTEQFGAPAAVEALENAATIARKDMKNYKLEIELRSKIAADYATSADAAEQFYDAAEVYEDDLKDADDALKTYREVAQKFPDAKYGKKAADRAAKLEKK